MALDALTAAFDLSPFERDVVIMCAGIELDSSFASLCASAQGNSHRTDPTFGLALAALPQAHWSALAPASPLRRWRLVELTPGALLTTSALRIDERVLHFLTGVAGSDERLTGIIQPVASSGAIVPSHQALAERIVATWRAPSVTRPVVQLCGDAAYDAREICIAAADAVGLRLSAVSADLIPTAPNDTEALSRCWQREAILSGSALLVECGDLDADSVAQTAAVARFVESIPGALVIASREQRRLRRRLTVAVDIAKPTTDEQLTVWRGALGDDVSATLNGHVERLVGQFRLTAPAIRAATTQALGAASIEHHSLAERVWDACRAQARPRLDDLAQRIAPSASWDDLVLPEAQKQVLRDIGAHVRHRVLVYETWGFGRRGNRGLGLSALFAGSSGTGKTMAAEVIASELRLDLYRIDLSSVVSKYIGETEKNLRRIFDAAEDGGAILLFDEADALFGKRSEVKDSHDRYANIEVSYLLQRMEAYRGLAILTTNLRHALDTAFLQTCVVRRRVSIPRCGASLGDLAARSPGAGTDRRARSGAPREAERCGRKHPQHRAQRGVSGGGPRRAAADDPHAQGRSQRIREDGEGADRGGDRRVGEQPMSRMNHCMLQRKKTETHESTVNRQPTPAPAAVAQQDAHQAVDQSAGVDVESGAEIGEAEIALADGSLGHDFGSMRVTSPRRAAAPGSPDDRGEPNDVASRAMRTAEVSPGHVLPGGFKSQLETSFGRDLSDVRVHSDSDAGEAARVLGARAFTVGRDVYVGSGQSDHDTEHGKRLLAHEVAHTVQQSEAAHSAHSERSGLTIGGTTTTAEHEADAAAEAAAFGARGAGNLVHAGSISEPLIQRKDDDPNVDNPPPPPAFTPTSRGFSTLASAVADSTRGGKKGIPSPDGEFSASTSNFNAFVDNAQGSHTYHTHRAPEDTKGKGAVDTILGGLKNFALKDSMAGELAKNDLADMTWGQNLVAEVSVARAATSSWLPVLTRGNGSWTTLVDNAKAMNIEVYNKAPSPLAKLAPGATPTPGAEQISAVEVGGEGNLLAGMAKKAGMKQGPDTTALREAMADFQTLREKVANALRGVVSLLFQSRKDATTGLTEAAEKDKESWQAYKLALDSFATGMQAALGAEAEVAGEKVSLEGEGSSKVVEGVNGEPATVTGVPSPTSASDKAGKVAHGLSALIDMKIAKIDKTIGAYNAQAGTWNAVIAKQMDLKNINDYKTALGEQQKLAKRVEDQQDALEKKLVEWGAEIDRRLQAQGKAPKDSNDAAQAAGLLSKIRVAKVDTDGAVEALSGGGTAALSSLYENISKDVSTRKEDQTGGNGRTDPRSRLFAIEASRWADAKGSLTTIEAALKERQGNLAELETNFLSTLAQNASPGSGSLIGPQY